MKKSILILCLVALLCGVIGWTSYGQKTNRQKATWEYMVKQEGGVYGRRVNLNELGTEGWELTAVTTEIETVNDRSVPLKFYFFKREK